jgi:hypothetical protein
MAFVVFTSRTRTKGAEIIVGIDPRAMAIAPAKLDGIVSNGPDLFQRRTGNRNKSALRPMPLAKRARAIAAEIFLGVFPDVIIVPFYPHNPTGFDMVDLGWIARFSH